MDFPDEPLDTEEREEEDDDEPAAICNKSQTKSQNKWTKSC